MAMKSKFLFFIFCLWAGSGFAQNYFFGVVRDGQTREPLPDISVLLKGTGKGSVSDANGKIVLKKIPNGKQVLVFSGIGYREQNLEMNFPVSAIDSVFNIALEREGKEIDQVIIYSSRTDSRIENTPTRVEVIGTEEVKEESGVKPSHIAGLLGDVAGIQAQQTSVATGNTELRIQGLPGDYTQILRDGMPLFGGYAGSFSILQIQPLDLKQIEIIKGASSTLYGGGAMAGMINIISKKPKEGLKERSLLFNQSTLRESNINLYLTERNKKLGYTFFGGGAYQKEADPDKDGFSDVGSQETFFLHPTLYYYPNEKNILSLGVNSNYEERNGGDMLVLNRQTDLQHQFFIQNQSNRNTVDIVWENTVSRTEKLTVKMTASKFNRNMTTNVFGMKAKQLSYYSEASYALKNSKHDVVGGINANGENFKKRLPDSSGINDYKFFTLGFFMQDDWRIHPKLTIESGLRTDFHNQYGVFVLPRISLLYKISHVVTTRLGGGMGYKVPTLFGSSIDERDYGHLHLADNAEVEKSIGVNWDINIKKYTGTVLLSFNQSFFYTRINHPLVAFTPPGFIFYYNEVKPLITKGMETWAQVSYSGLDAYLGFTLMDSRKKYDTVHPHLDLSARNKFASVISYEFSKRIRACI